MKRALLPFLASAVLVDLVTGAPRALATCPPGSYFLPPYQLPAAGNPFRILAGDLNGDGAVDLVAANSTGQVLTFHLGIPSAGKGTGQFRPPIVFPGLSSPSGVNLADFDENGILDLAVTFGDGVYVFLGAGPDLSGVPIFGAGTRYQVASEAADIESADLDADGILDLVVGSNSLSISVLYGQGQAGIGDGTFSAATRLPTPSGAYEVETGDFNGDGLLDVAGVGCCGSPALLVLFGLGDRNFAVRPAMFLANASGGLDLDAGDLNGDGLTDLVTAGTDGNSYPRSQVRVYLGRRIAAGGVENLLESNAIQLKQRSAFGLLLDDLNGDLVPDALVTNLAGSSVSILLGQERDGVGLGALAFVDTIPTSGDNYRATSADVTGDGLPDIVVAQTTGLSVFPRVCPANGNMAPNLDRIRDISGDQGGHVSVGWKRSPLDIASAKTIMEYRVWRRTPLPSAADVQTVQRDHESALGPNDGTYRAIQLQGQTTYWEPIGTIPAGQLAGYGFTAPTTRDSLPGSNPFTAFFVSALTEDPFVFFDSNVDSGYSVDNLAPASPQALRGQSFGGSSVVLSWRPNTEQDLSHYAVYRGIAAGFVPSSQNRIGTTSDTTLADQDGRSYWHKISAFDVHTNESPYAILRPSDVSGVEDHNVSMVSPPVPNPASSGS